MLKCIVDGNRLQVLVGLTRFMHVHDAFVVLVAALAVHHGRSRPALHRQGKGKQPKGHKLEPEQHRGNVADLIFGGQTDSSEGIRVATPSSTDSLHTDIDIQITGMTGSMTS
jgi:hypothetical protein